MKKDIKFEIKQETLENLELFSQILNKNINTIFNEALEQYFENEQQKLVEKNQDNENSLTNLDYNEFWDGFDLD